MERIYEERPNISEDAYLSSDGKYVGQQIYTHLSNTITELENAVMWLGKIEGMGTELYIERLKKLIKKYDDKRIDILKIMK